MNRSSELAIKWLLAHKGHQDNEISSTINALYQGCADKDDETLNKRDTFLIEALEAAEADEDWDFIINQAVRLHIETESVDATIRNVDRIEKIKRVMSTPRDSIIAKRIAKNKVEGLINDIE